MNRIISLILIFVLLLSLLSLSACQSNTEADVTEEKMSVSDEVTESPPESEDTGETVYETEEQIFTVELTRDDTEDSFPTEAVGQQTTEIDIAGNYVPPETTGSETLPTVAAPYEPYVPSGSGRAPLALMYHLVLDTPFTSLENLFVRPSELRGHIEALLEAGYTFIFADEYAYSDEKTVIMSFDDGYVDNYTEMFPIIKEYNIKVTVFMVAGYIGGDGYLTGDMIKEMASSGLVSFQSHTYNHSSLIGLSEDSLRYEFSESNRIIESLTGRTVKAICYPAGKYNDTVLSIAEEYYDFGYTTVSRTSTEGYPAIELPRLRVNRGFSKSYFASLLP